LDFVADADGALAPDDALVPAPGAVVVGVAVDEEHPNTRLIATVNMRNRVSFGTPTLNMLLLFLPDTRLPFQQS
jgi:hypothetical protein